MNRYDPTPADLDRAAKTLIAVLARAQANLDRAGVRPVLEETTAGSCYEPRRS